MDPSLRPGRFLPPLAAALPAALLPAPAAAQSPIAAIVCAPSAEMADRLTRQFLARREGQGLRDEGTLFELWTSAAGAWTLVVIYPTGQSCIVAMGEAWEPARPDPA